MPVTLLDADAELRLRAAPFTYAEVGQSAGTPPPGYASFTRTVTLRPGIDFDEAATALLGWQVQQRAGIRVSASSLRVEPDAVALLRIAVLPAPCRVVYVVDEPDRQGFAYGTLPGHPESGEESFVLTRTGSGIDFTVTAFSKPATLLAKLGGPLGSAAQRVMTARYLRAFSR